MIKYSVVVPIYNRPKELDELLESLTLQEFTDFEVIIIEDGSSISSEQIVKKFESLLKLQYFSKPNEGQGFGRNYGAKYASGDYLIFFDSDVIVPKEYFKAVDAYLEDHKIDAFGGEDKASDVFSDFQKALSYSMTSVLTTGGIRNKNQNVGGNYHIRSYNCGIKTDLFREIGGFKKTNMGEDMELNNRLEKLQVLKCLIPNAFVYHKRRGDFTSFFKQIFSFGRTRVQLKKNYGIPIKIVHLFPVSFVLFTIFALLVIWLNIDNKYLPIGLLSLYFGAIFVHSTVSTLNLKVGFLSTIASFIQHLAYGLGFLKEMLFPDKK
jgi:glycosyltransferase involved in cell wall biosynthesis